MSRSVARDRCIIAMVTFVGDINLFSRSSRRKRPDLSKYNRTNPSSSVGCGKFGAEASSPDLMRDKRTAIQSLFMRSIVKSIVSESPQLRPCIAILRGRVACAQDRPRSARSKGTGACIHKRSRDRPAVPTSPTMSGAYAASDLVLGARLSLCIVRQ